MKLFPGKEKYESKVQKESWPVYNQDFIFPIQVNSDRLEDILIGKFVVLTVYAILENQSNDNSSSAKGSRLSESSFKNFFTKDIKRSESAKSNRMSLHKRRTIGAVTYNLDLKTFTQNLKSNIISTPDIWRTVKSISSGLAVNEKNVSY